MSRAGLLDLPANYLSEAGAGTVQNASAVTVFGQVINVAAATPMGGWDAQIPFNFLTAASAWEVVSSSANDAAAGTGMRTILINTLDGDYREVAQVVTLNGTTPVPLVGTHLFHNSSIGLTSGSGTTNAGNITIRQVSGPVTMGFILAGHGITKQALYTVPAGKQLLIHNFLYCHAIIGITTGGVSFQPFLRFQNGTIFQGIWQNINSNQVNAYPLPVPFAQAEKISFGYNLGAATTSTGTFASGLTGVLRPIPT
jgi:hypothetical protein